MGPLNPRAGTVRLWAAPPLQEKVTLPPGAIATEDGDQ